MLVQPTSAEPDRLPTRPLLERPDQAVRRLIQELDRYAAATGEDVTVVLDRRPPDVLAGAHGAVLVAFASRRGRDAADDEIVRMLAEDRAPHSFRAVTRGTGIPARSRPFMFDFRRSFDAVGVQ
jgi:hypothetical protein